MVLKSAYNLAVAIKAGRYAVVVVLRFPAGSLGSLHPKWRPALLIAPCLKLGRYTLLRDALVRDNALTSA
jgi:hypothetical protein